VSAAVPNRPEGVTCAEFADGLVTDYMEDALSAERRDAVRDHLSGCEICTRLLAAMRRVAAAIRGVARDPVDAAARAAVLADCRPVLAELRRMTAPPDAGGGAFG
jgi:anti-sigma factor RsiW